MGPEPIKQICRDPRLSRNTVRKVIRSGASEFSHDRTTQPRPKIDPWRSELDELLAENARRPRREPDPSRICAAPLTAYRIVK